MMNVLQLYFEPDLQPHFTHELLPSTDRAFRLLRLFPGHGDQPLQSSLEVHNLDSKPDYDALSYLWGPREPMKLMFIDDQEFLVRPNIHSFLLRLRHPGKHRMLWLDAVCIDQTNVEERSHQVSLMRDIYQSCRECLAWLGESDDGQDEVAEVLRKSPVDEQGMADLNHLVRQLYVRQLVTSFKSFMTHAYWSRVWMIQETTLPKKITIHSSGSTCGLDNMLTQVRGRMFELFQRDRVQYQQWLKVFKPFERKGELTKSSIEDFNIVAEDGTRDNRGRVYFPFIFDCSVVFETNRHFLAFSATESSPRWQAVIVQEDRTHLTDLAQLPNGNQSFSHKKPILLVKSIMSLSDLSKLSFSPENFDPECAFHAIEVIFWCISNTTSEQLLDERRRYSTANSRRFSKVDFRNYLEAADSWFCTDVRDRVFAILGVIEVWPRSKPFRADYRLTVQDLLVEVLDYCRPTDPFKLAIRLSSALRVDLSQMQNGPVDQTLRSPITVMSRIGWRSSIFHRQKILDARPNHEYSTVWMCRLDVPPPLEPVIYVHLHANQPQDADEIISIGDAGIVIGIRKNLKGQAAVEEYSCIGLGWNAGFQARLVEDESGNLMLLKLEDPSVRNCQEHTDLVKEQTVQSLEPLILRQGQADVEALASCAISERFG